MGKFDGILIASDFDGTVAVDGIVSPENHRAIDYFMENGGMFTLATGRAPAFIGNIGINMNLPLICINGTVIYDRDNNKYLRNYTFDRKYITIAKEVVSMEEVLRVSVFSLNEFPYTPPKPEDFDYFDKPINKIVFVFKDEASCLRAKAYLKEKYSHLFCFERSWNTGLEMRSVDSGKGKCLKYLKELCGASVAIGVGDYENDTSLIESADISYCPESSHPDILKLADRVTVSCKDHAVAKIIYELEEKIEKGIDIYAG